MEHISHTAQVVTAVVLMLMIAAGTLGFSKLFKLPFSVLLVLVGMAVAALVHTFPLQFGILGILEISPDLILFIFLPALIFESTFNMDVHRLRENLGPVLMLAAPGLLLSTAVIGCVVWLITGLPLTASLLLGAILSATDPVAVIALFKQLGAPKRLVVMVEGESLFNDATSIVLAKILLAVVVAGSLSTQVVGNGVLNFIVLFLGGLLTGVVLGWIAGLFLGMVEADALIEISITTVAAYLSFLLAEELLHVSGVMATVGTGLTLGGWGWSKISPPVRVYLESFWEYMAFAANAFIFLLVGMKVSLPELWQSLDVLLVVIFAMILARAATVFGLAPILAWMPGIQPINLKYQAVMFWGGLRGAIALAIVLSLEDFEYASLFTNVVMGSVLFSLLVQGLSTGKLMHLLDLDRPPLIDMLARLDYRLSAQRKALQLIPRMQHGGQFSRSIAENVRHEILDDMANAQQEMKALRQRQLGPDKEQALLLLRSFVEEKACYCELFARGNLSESAHRRLQLTLDNQMEALRHHGHFVRIQPISARYSLDQYIHSVLVHIPGLCNLSERLRMSQLNLDYEIDWAHHQSAQQVLERLQELATLESVSPEVVREVKEHYLELKRSARKHLDDTALQLPEFAAAMQKRLARSMVLITAAATAELHAKHGALQHEMAEQIQHELRREINALHTPVAEGKHFEAAELLRKLPFLKAIPEHEFERLAQDLHSHSLATGEAAAHQDETIDTLYLIACGVMRVRQEKGGETHELATLMAGDYFGELALQRDETCSASIVAMTPCTVYELKREAWASWIQRHPAILASLEESDSKRLNKRHS